jgi:hypothetical protein
MKGCESRRQTIGGRAHGEGIGRLFELRRIAKPGSPGGPIQRLEVRPRYTRKHRRDSLAARALRLPSLQKPFHV